MAASAANEKEQSNKFAVDALNSHNVYRKRHGAAQLSLNRKICKFAQEWTDRCANSSKMAHRDKCPYGENIFCHQSSDPKAELDAEQPVRSWYDGIKHHKFGEETVNPQTLHFTQVVWKGTKEMGIGAAKNKKELQT